ncbi:M20 family metallopeptidase [Ruminococcaceae bacterium OttesenSCG-928-A11]|nr:M20 family metallopeptidase [Ruminococcaceae bacterium OttesenSCG-928-A11]
MPDRDAILAAVREEELVKWTMELVRIPSHPGVPEQETGVARYIKSVFDAEGIECALTEVADGRCNVTARLPGTGAGKTLLLCGHIDTVEPYDMERATDPFIESGNIHGRGTSDMKGPVACMMAALIGLKRRGVQLPGDLVFAGVIDEESASLGTIDLIERGIKADGAIVGEPSALQLCVAHRGLEWLEFHFIGKTVHGGRQREGINAIQKAVDFINLMNETLVPKVYARKHPLLVEATINAGVIQGGTQLSTVAGDCTLLVDRRFLPSENYDDAMQEFRDLLAELERRDPQFKCEMKVMDVSVMKPGYIHAPMEIDQGDPLVLAMAGAVEAATGGPAVKTLFPAWTDGGLLSHYAGIPCLVIGPGEIEACHSKAECIAIDQLNKGYLAYTLLAEEFCSQPKPQP